MRPTAGPGAMVAPANERRPPGPTARGVDRIHGLRGLFDPTTTIQRWMTRSTLRPDWQRPRNEGELLRTNTSRRERDTFFLPRPPAPSFRRRVSPAGKRRMGARIPPMHAPPPFPPDREHGRFISLSPGLRGTCSTDRSARPTARTVTTARRRETRRGRARASRVGRAPAGSAPPSSPSTSSPNFPLQMQWMDVLADKVSPPQTEWIPRRMEGGGSIRDPCILLPALHPVPGTPGVVMSMGRRFQWFPSRRHGTRDRPRSIHVAHRHPRQLQDDTRK